MPALSWFAPKIKASGAASLLPKTQLRRDSEFLLRPENDPRTTQVIRRELYGNLVTREDANVMHAHLSRYEAKDDMPILKLYPKRRVREVFENLPLHFNEIFFRHPYFAV
jgi:hypothetical protein